MAQFEQFTYVDLSAGIRKVPVNGGIFSHDIKSHKLGVIVTNHNQPVTLTGQIMGIAKLATGEKLEFSGSIDDQDASRAYVELPESAYITGPLTVAIRNIDTNSNKIVLIAYTGYVDGATDGTPVVPPGTLPDDIEDFLAELDNMREIVADAEEAVENIDDIVLVQETQPTSEINKIWIQPQPDEYKVPTWEEYSDLKSAISGYDITGTNVRYTEIGITDVIPIGITIKNNGVPVQLADGNISTQSYTNRKDLSANEIYTAMFDISYIRGATEAGAISIHVYGMEHSIGSQYVELIETIDAKTSTIITPENYSFVCVHHDNFSRTETGWEMGKNAGPSYDVNNYEYVGDSDYDDGFRVDDGLTCASDSARTKAFSVRKLKADHDKDFMVEFSCPVYPNYNNIAWDITDVQNFTMLQIGRESSYIRVLCVPLINGIYGTNIFSKNVYNVNPEIVQVYFVNGVCTILFDDQMVASFKLTPFNSKVGIASYKSYSLAMSFINMFNLTSHVVFNPNYIIDRNIETVPTTLINAPTGRYELSSDPARWSNYAEHFTLESTDEMIYHGIRAERSTKSLVDTNLRTVYYEFDVLFPTEYGFDRASAHYHDSMFQFHDRESDLSTRGDVCFYLAVIGDKLTVYMSSTHEALSDDVVTQANFEPILTIEKGKWYHFEIYQKERYDENQHPYTQIKIDGVTVWESRKPNAYNDRRGSGLQYGIYKNNWDLITEMGRYFDNVKVTF